MIIVRDLLTENNSKEENREKILALAIITLAILIIPFCIFIVVLFILFSANSLLDYFSTWNLFSGLKGLTYLVCAGFLVLFIRYITNWLRN